MKRKHILPAVLLFLAVPQLSAQQSAATQEKSSAKVISWTTSSQESKDQLNAAIFNNQFGYGARAAERTRGLVAKDPSFALAKVYFNFAAGNAAEANAAVPEVAKASLGEYLLASIWSNRSLNHPDVALALAKAGIEIYPDEPLFAMEMASAASVGDTKKGIELFSAVADKFKYAPAYRAISNRKLTDGDTAGALAALETAMKLAPNSGSTHASYARLLMISGNFPAARDHFNAGIQASPDNGDVHLQMAELETVLGNHAAAREHIGHAVERGLTDNDKLRFHRTMVVSYGAEGRFADAKKELEAVLAHAKAINDRTQIQVGYRNLALLAAVMKTPAGIQPNLDAALAAGDPAIGNTQGALAAWLEAGNGVEAQKAVDGYIAAVGPTPTAVQQRYIHALTAGAKLAARDPAAALAHLAQADPSSQLTQYFVWKAHVAAGHKKEAAQAKQTLLARRDFSLQGLPGAVGLALVRAK